MSNIDEIIRAYEKTKEPLKLEDYIQEAKNLLIEAEYQITECMDPKDQEDVKETMTTAMEQCIRAREMTEEAIVKIWIKLDKDIKIDKQKQ